MTPELEKLLPLAAKAANIKILKWCEATQAYEIDAPRAYWNPTTDDEDLLYLARDAGLVVNFEDCCAWCWPGTASDVFDWVDGDYVGMCMAIVRAAAEKGRAM